MSKSIKLKNNNYWDTKAINHYTGRNRKNLNEYLSPVQLVAGTSLNDYLNEGFYAGIGNEINDMPENFSNNFSMMNIRTNPIYTPDLVRFNQILFKNNTLDIYIRQYQTNGFTDWYKINMTKVS